MPAMETPLTRNIRPDREPLDFDGYRRAGGYAAADKALRMSPKDVADSVTKSNLRGRGGAGFPTGKKWSFVPMGEDAPHPKYLVVNADEMEPGAFKDRLLLEGDPHQMIEAIIVSAYAIQADMAFIFLRGEYRTAEERLSRAIAEAHARGYLGRDIGGTGWSLDCRLHTSAGRYICGEETALLSALEGRRAIPRSKPPFPQAAGLWGKPTVVNNVETLCNVPHIVANGPEWFHGLGRTGDGGTKIFGVSGRVKRPGAWELPMGTSLREIIEDRAGGMADGFAMTGLLPGGASTGILGPEDLDLAMDFDTIGKAGSRFGTGTVIVVDDSVCPVGLLRNLEHFFAQESCGWCTPCRDGLSWVEKILGDIEDGAGTPESLDELAEHTRFLAPGLTYCAHAPGAAMPLETGLKRYRDAFERHIREQRCPWA
jgi:NADH-quinone oxidoreductase subunit F